MEQSTRAVREPPAFQDEETRYALRQEALRLLLRITFGLSCAWILYLALVIGNYQPEAGMAPLGVMAVCGITWWLVDRQPVLASAFCPAALLAVALVHDSLLGIHTGALYVPLVVVVASAVSPRRWVVALALTACMALAGTAWLESGTVDALTGTAILLTVLAATAAWVLTRSTQIALDWATRSQAQAQENLAALRARRAELRKLADMLHNNEDRMHYLNINLEQARVAAEEAYRTKQHFVANVSHELRTPLNLITGFSEMMAFSPESYGGLRLPAPYQEDVMQIYRSSKHLLGLVEDVLALAQLEAGQLIVQREMADVATVVREATEAIGPLIEGKGLELKVEVGPDLPLTLMDSGRIRQVLLNLLNNAYRFTEEGNITVRVRRAARDLLIEVSDTGIGINPEDMPRIFEEFHSLSKGPAARRNGFGLGLSISRRLVEAHAGRLSAESTLGQGSRFVVSLPVTADPDSTRRPTLVHTAPLAAVDRRKRAILAVGDGWERFDRYLGDYSVVHTTPEEVVEAYGRTLPAAIWLNSDPPVCETPGYLAPILRAAPSIPIINCRVPTRTDIARKLQADAFLPKPVTLAELTRVLAQVTQKGSPSEADRADPKGLSTVLVIDDDMGLLQLLQRMLASFADPAYRIIQACGGREGLALLETERPDIVLLDLSMPEVSGYDILQAMHEREGYRGTRVVLMSGVEANEEATPSYVITLQSQAGISLQESLNVVRMLVGELSDKVAEPQVLQGS